MTIVAPDRRIVDQNGNMTPRFQVWAEQVTQLDILTGTGSPETVVAAEQKRFYMDLAGTAGSILYIKRDADIGGDKTQGWILV